MISGAYTSSEKAGRLFFKRTAVFSGKTANGARFNTFEKSLRYVNSFDVTALIEAIYDMVDQNQAACRVLILGNTNSTVLMRMIALAKDDSIAYWRKELPNASETDLEMMYTHLSNGLMHVVVEGYDKYSKDEIIRFVSRVVKASLSLFQSPQRPLA